MRSKGRVAGSRISMGPKFPPIEGQGFIGQSEKQNLGPRLEPRGRRWRDVGTTVAWKRAGSEPWKASPGEGAGPDPIALLAALVPIYVHHSIQSDLSSTLHVKLLPRHPCKLDRNAVTAA